MASPGKVQLNLRVAPEIRDACRRLASRAGLSLNLWAEGVLEAAGASDAMVPAEPLPGQTELTDMEQAQSSEAVNGQTGRLEASLTVAEEPHDSLIPSSPPGERDEAPAACPECAGEMQPYDIDGTMTTRCEDCGYWGDGG